MPQIIQLNPTIPLTTPKGNGYAHFLIEHGDEYHLQWVVFQDDTNECWTWNNTDIHIQSNITMGRPQKPKWIKCTCGAYNYGPGAVHRSSCPLAKCDLPKQAEIDQEAVKASANIRCVCGVGQKLGYVNGCHINHHQECPLSRYNLAAEPMKCTCKVKWSGKCEGVFHDPGCFYYDRAEID